MFVIEPNSINKIHFNFDLISLNKNTFARLKGKNNLPCITDCHLTYIKAISHEPEHIIYNEIDISSFDLLSVKYKMDNIEANLDINTLYNCGSILVIGRCYDTPDGSRQGCCFR